MKTGLTILLSLLFFSAFAQKQAIDEFYINFDNNDSSYNAYRMPTTRADTSFKHWITIDTNYNNNKWQIGHPNKIVFTSALTNPNAIITDSVNSCIPNDTSVFIMKFPVHEWDGFRFFKFSYKLDIDSGDIVKVEVSADTGRTWKDLITDTSGFFYFWHKPDLAKSNINWDTTEFFISYSVIPLTVDTFLARFTFITGDSIKPRDGWMIDNIVIGSNGEAVPQLENDKYFKMYPNPVSDKLGINYNLPVSKDVYICLLDMSGHIVLYKRLKHVQSGNVILPTADIPSGIYNCSIQAGDAAINRAIIIRH